MEKTQTNTAGENVFYIEICRDCARHNQHTRHDEAKYKAIFDECKKAIEDAVPRSQVLVKPVAHPRLGAFEITHNNNLIFSKLKSTLFPVGAKIAERVRLYLADLQGGKDVKKYANMKEQRQLPAKKSFDARHTYGNWYVAMQQHQNQQ